ncbi:unnamed protein product [Penicillium salamii]|uniref:F-box domain-containing protein n=1 Tax=Penicillium salamii TaxID=1612424 RepID=A0A9W4JRU6_9EURO|nr:unnamed protein product [Penicillium salamii]
MNGDSPEPDATNENSATYCSATSPGHCVSCKWSICTRKLVGNYYPWMEFYQAIYLTSEGVQLSGVYKAGSETLEGINILDIHEEDVVLRHWWSLANNKPPKAFLIHSCCWSLLRTHFTDNDIDVDRLFEVCKRRPASRTNNNSGDWILRMSCLQHPLLRPVIRGIGDVTKQLSKIQRSKKNPNNNIIFTNDAFNLFPMEIRLEIAAYLSTTDFLQLRLISRAMASVFSLQSFWKTRFRINGERGF